MSQNGSGLPLLPGAQLVVDVTVRSALTAHGLACVGAATTDGVVLARARGDKERKHHELLAGERCRLVVVGIETGGQWSGEAANFVCDLAGVSEGSVRTTTVARFHVLRLKETVDAHVVRLAADLLPVRWSPRGLMRWMVTTALHPTWPICLLRAEFGA